MNADRIAPPQEHDARRWHWIETQHGMMCASWFPKASDNGLWDISGHTYDAGAPMPLREWRYAGPAVPPPVS